MTKTQAIRSARACVHLVKMGHAQYAVYYPYDWDRAARPPVGAGRFTGTTTCGPAERWHLARRSRTELVAQLALYMLGYAVLEELDGEFSSIPELVARGIAGLSKR